VEVATQAMAPGGHPAPIDAATGAAVGRMLSVVLLGVWGAGAVAMMAGMMVAQRRFRQGLGRLQPLWPGIAVAETCIGLPAAIGLWRPLIVFPADFRERYSAEQLELLRQHEC